MTKQCTNCGGWGTLEIFTKDRFYRCYICNGTGSTDDAEYESETCECNGDGCSRCKGTGEVWRKVDGETTEGDK